MGGIMINAKQEFLREILGMELVCAQLDYVDPYENISKTFNLPVGYNQMVLDIFLNSLDFEYDNGYGTQYLYGTIWYEGAGWSERSEYDGSESWSYCKKPEIPDELLPV
jgi:hypothetical protein